MNIELDSLGAGIYRCLECGDGVFGSAGAKPAM
jgi:hypothetical protein